MTFAGSSVGILSRVLVSWVRLCCAAVIFCSAARMAVFFSAMVRAGSAGIAARGGRGSGGAGLAAAGWGGGGARSGLAAGVGVCGGSAGGAAFDLVQGGGGGGCGEGAAPVGDEVDGAGTAGGERLGVGAAAVEAEQDLPAGHDGAQLVQPGLHGLGQAGGLCGGEAHRPAA